MKKYTFSTVGLRYYDKLCFRVDGGPHAMVLFPFDVQCNKIHIFLCVSVCGFGVYMSMHRAVAKY